MTAAIKEKPMAVPHIHKKPKPKQEVSVQQIKLPYPFTTSSVEAGNIVGRISGKIEGWQEPGKLLISVAGNIIGHNADGPLFEDSWRVLNEPNTCYLLKELGLFPESIPGYKKSVSAPRSHKKPKKQHRPADQVTGHLTLDLGDWVTLPFPYIENGLGCAILKWVGDGLQIQMPAEAKFKGETQWGGNQTKTAVLNEEESSRLLERLGLFATNAKQIFYKKSSEKPEPKKDVPTQNSIQKIKLPYPYTSGKHYAMIEGWSEKDPRQLLISEETERGVREFFTLSKADTALLLRALGLQPENVPGYVPFKTSSEIPSQTPLRIGSGYSYRGSDGVQYDIQGWGTALWVGGEYPDCLVVKFPKGTKIKNNHLFRRNKNNKLLIWKNGAPWSTGSSSWYWALINEGASEQILRTLNLKRSDIPESLNLVMPNSSSQKDKPEKVKLPFEYEIGGKGDYAIQGWLGDGTQGELLCSQTNKNGQTHYFPLNKNASAQLLIDLDLTPDQISASSIQETKSDQTEYVSMLEWEEFQRWKQGKKELEAQADENLDQFKELLRILTQTYPDFNEEFDELLDGLRKAPRQIRCIRSGEYPPMEMDDDELNWYEENTMRTKWGQNYTESYKRKGKLVVKVVIEDISDGKL
jgi:hypothetical protein